ncbi:MAG TPA: LUD domain-containing protein [Myxococcales bacterium]|nr:LUD domain-containing protein [Myxococcales bacterium]
MAARDEILNRLRAASPKAVALPDLSRFAPPRAHDVRERFGKSVVEVGGRVANGFDEVPEFAGARKIVSLAPGIAGNVDLAAVRDPHDLHDVDFCIVPAALGVAENGACWIEDHGGANRAVCYLAQHIGIVVSAASLVHDMHEAYERIALKPGFAMFLSGPSKTADIEQSLVIGAHGPRSCTVVITP